MDNSTLNDMVNSLHEAVNKNSKVEVVTILNAMPSIIDSSKNGYTPVHIACRNGHLEIVKILMDRGANVDTARPDAWTPLHSACWVSHPEVVKVLLRKANPNKLNSDGWNALHIASMNNNHEIVKCLLDAKADMSAKTMSSETALDIAMKRDPNSKVSELLKHQIIEAADWTELHIACCYDQYDTLLDLIKNDPSFDKCNTEGCTALHLACEKGHLRIVQKLLECKIPVNIEDKENRTALHIASCNGHTDIVKLLLDYDADTNICDKNGDTAIVIAQRKKHYDVVKFLEVHDGSTPLHTAIRCKDSCEVKRLVDESKKVNINASTSFGCTALHYASRQGCTEIVRILKDNGADVDIPRKDGWTALQSASSLGHTEVVRELLCKSTSIDNKNQDGMTALHYACKYGHYEVVQLLIDAKADISIQDIGGRTALHHASYSGKLETVKLLLKHQPDLIDHRDHYESAAIEDAIKCNHLSIVKFLQKQGASINSYYSNGKTLLHQAVELGCEEIAKYLIETGHADVNARTKFEDEVTSLHIACSNHQVSIVELLLLKGAQPEKSDKHGFTALHHAVRSENCVVVKCILDANIGIINAKNKKLNTALHLAASIENCEICSVLINANADVNCANEDGDTPLHIASAKGCSHNVNELLQAESIVVNATNKAGDTASHIASKNQYSSIEMAILKKTPIDVKNPSRWLLNNVGRVMSSKYFEFGIQLLVPQNTLRSIAQRYAQENYNVHFFWVAHEWTERITVPVTWGNLIEVLHAIDEPKLAEDFKTSVHSKKFCADS